LKELDEEFLDHFGNILRAIRQTWID